MGQPSLTCAPRPHLDVAARVRRIRKAKTFDKPFLYYSTFQNESVETCSTFQNESVETRCTFQNESVETKTRDAFLKPRGQKNESAARVSPPTPPRTPPHLDDGLARAVQIAVRGEGVAQGQGAVCSHHNYMVYRYTKPHNRLFAPQLHSVPVHKTPGPSIRTTITWCTGTQNPGTVYSHHIYMVYRYTKPRDRLFAPQLHGVPVHKTPGPSIRTKITAP